MSTTVHEVTPTSTVPGEWPDGEPKAIRELAEAKQGGKK